MAKDNVIPLNNPIDNPFIHVELSQLEARVLFHLLNDLLQVDRMLIILPHANERQAAREAYQKIRFAAYGHRNVQ